MTGAREKPIRLAGRTLKDTRHICAFFRSKEEQNEVLMPFFKEGYDRGEKVFHIVDKRHRAEHLDCCRKAGIDVERMIRVLKEVLSASRAHFPLMRLMGNMEWALEAPPGGDAIHPIAMTGWGQEQDKQRARDAGFDLHVTKPGHPERIAALLARLAAERRART